MKTIVYRSALATLTILAATTSAMARPHFSSVGCDCVRQVSMSHVRHHKVRYIEDEPRVTEVYVKKYADPVVYTKVVKTVTTSVPETIVTRTVATPSGYIATTVPTAVVAEPAIVATPTAYVSPSGIVSTGVVSTGVVTTVPAVTAVPVGGVVQEYVTTGL